MSIFSTLKSLFGGPARSQQPTSQAPPPRPVPKAPDVPKIVPTSTDRLHVKAPKMAVAVEPGIKCDFLTAKLSLIESIPEDTEIRWRLDATNSKQLKTLPSNLRTGSLVLRGCEALEALPNGLDVAFLDIQGCNSLKSLPFDLRLRGGALNMRGCAGVTKLPADMGEVASLDLGGCSGLTEVPDGLKVTSWIDITGTEIRALPPGFEHVGLRDNGKVVTAQEAFAQ